MPLSSAAPAPGTGVQLVITSQPKDGGVRLPAGPPALTLEVPRGEGTVTYRVFNPDGDPILEVEGVADFHVTANAIVYRAHAGAHGADIEDCLVSWAMGLWLEQRGRRVLHGAAIEVDGRAMLLLGVSGAGKSTLARGFAHRGFRLLGDDLVPVCDVAGQPAAWPSLPRVGVRAPRPPFLKTYIPLDEAQFCPQARPLAAIYILRRRPESTCVPTFRTVSSSEALIQCVRYSILARTVIAAGLQPRRLAAFAGSIPRVPVYELEYGSDLAGLSEVCRQTADHLRRIVASVGTDESGSALDEQAGMDPAEQLVPDMGR